MHDFMKTIMSSLQTWVNKRIKNNTPNWNENDSEADGYIKNRPFYTDEEKVVQIDKKYLPDATTYLNENVFRPDYEIYDETQVGYIKNRPCYCMKIATFAVADASLTSPCYVDIPIDKSVIYSNVSYRIEGTVASAFTVGSSIYHTETTVNASTITQYDHFVNYDYELNKSSSSNWTMRLMLSQVVEYDASDGQKYLRLLFSTSRTGTWQSYYFTITGVDIHIYALKELDPMVIPESIVRVENIIPIPATASVGQIITVKSVDENGKPTEWEAIDRITIDDVVAAINNPKDKIAFIDQVNGYTYIVKMCDGNIVSYCMIKSIEVTTMPTKTSYIHGEYFDPTDMVVTATYQDGLTKEITDFTCPTTYLAEGTTSVEITYVEDGVTCVTSIPITVGAFDAATILVDFTYTDNGDGTYTITGWNGTYNGETSTEMIIPNYGCIIV